MSSRPARTLLLLALVALALGCGGRPRREDPILRLSAAEALAEGKRLFALDKYAAARPYFTHAFEVEPNSPGGREALLLAADSLFLQGHDENFIQAEARYRDFRNRFPTSDRAAYVQLQIARSLTGRMERPDRDQKVTHQAREALEELLRIYPDTPEAEQAHAELRTVRDRLAAHEMGVGIFYSRFRLPQAAVKRFEGVLAEYPDFSGNDELLYRLAVAYRRLDRGEEADQTLARLRESYPASDWTRRAAKEAG